MVRRCLLTLLLLTACQGGQLKGRKSCQEIHINSHTEPPNLDPRKATDTTSITILKMCFEGLTKLKSDGSVELAIAEKVEAGADQKSYTFYLKEAHWSDGSPVTAYDFEKTWKRTLDPQFLSDIASNLYVVKNAKSAKEGSCPLEDVGVKALDEKTLLVTLEHPAAHFLNLTATHTFLPTPTHIVERHPDWAEEATEHYICNGPFQMIKWRHHEVIVVEKNPNYWDAAKVKLDRINISILEDENTELHMFEQGELDWAGAPLSILPTDALVSLKRKNALQTYPIAGVYFYVFNTKAPPFDNVKMRRAFTLAINRQEVVENITQTGQKPAMGLIPPMAKHEPTAYFKDGDVEEAKKLFAEALDEMNMKASDLPIISLTYNTAEAHHKIAQVIQQQWHKAFGVKVRLANKEWKVFLDDLKKHQFQIARLGGVADVNDPSTFLDTYKYANETNRSDWNHPYYTELLEKADQTTDLEERLVILKQAEAFFMEEMPVAPIYFYTQSYLKKNHLQGVEVSELGEIDLKSAYVDLR